MANAYNDLWEKWKKSGSQESLSTLLSAFEPDIQWQVRNFANADVPDYAIEAEAKKNLIKAFQTYNPDMGVALRTHAVNYMKKTNRFVYGNQNVGRIPEARILNITRFDTAEQKLREKLSRAPSSSEIAEELRWDVKEVIRMRNERRPGVIGEGAEIGSTTYDFARDSALAYIYYSLPQNLRTIFEMTTGFGGHKPMSAMEIKRNLHLNDKEYRQARIDLQKVLKENDLQELLQGE